MGRRCARLVRVLTDESGNALIEAALVIPVVLALAFGVVAVGRVVHAQIAVQSIVREATRTVAEAPSLGVGLSDAQARAQAVAGGHGLAIDQLHMTIDGGSFERGGTVHAEATYPVTFADLPLLGLVQVNVSGAAQQRVEQYRSRTAVSP